MPTTIRFQAAFTTAPDLMHLVHTLVFWVFPPELAICTVFKLGSQRLLVLLWAWETLLPVTGPLPQISHTFAIFVSFSIPFPAKTRHNGGMDECFVIKKRIRIQFINLFSDDWQVLLH